MRLHFPTLNINKLIRRLSKAHQALPTLHYRAILQAAKILFVVLWLLIGSYLVLKIRVDYFRRIRCERLGRASHLHRVDLQLRWKSLLCLKFIFIHGYQAADIEVLSYISIQSSLGLRLTTLKMVDLVPCHFYCRSGRINRWAYRFHQRGFELIPLIPANMNIA